METVHQRIDKYFEKFLRSKLKFKVITIRVRTRLGFEYEYDFVDEWDSTGWILYKPFFSNKAKLYMFKGKKYTPLTFPPTRWYQITTRMGQAFEDFLNPPDRRMRNRAELRIVFGYIRLAIILAIIVMLIFYPHIKSTIAGESQDEVEAITQGMNQGAKKEVNKDVNKEVNVKGQE